jgi:hypothetical protein
MKNKLLPWIIALSAFTVSGSAAFYSVSGLGKMFAGASLQVMILAGSLEFAKLVTASLLYQYWKKLNIGLKIYLSTATLILILITSAGIYGFLSSAYQETSFKVQNQDKNIELLDKDILIAENEIKNYERQIDQKNGRLNQLTNIRSNLQSTQDVLIEKSKSTNSVRQQINDIDFEIKRMDSEISVLNDSISSKNSKISSIEQNKMEVSSDSDIAKEVGPLKYIAKLTNTSIDKVVNWYIIVLMLVFDPLAISLVIASNFAFEMAKEENSNIVKEKQIKKKKTMSLDFFKKLWKSIFPERKVKSELLVVNNDEEILVQDNINNIDSETTVESEVDLIETEETVNEKEFIGEKIIQEKSEISDRYNDEISDRYNDHIQLENQKVLRDRFRKNLGGHSIKNPSGEINPINLK